MSHQYLTDQPFSALDLPEPLQRGVQEAGFSHCTEIQAQALPVALAGEDVAGQAQTGTGKSAAFLLALFARLLREPPPEGRRPTQPRALVLAPTRELAIQIHKDAEVLGRHCGFKLGLVYGGTGYDSQRQMLEQGVDVLIGTPGRIIDFFKQRLFDLKAVQVFVLDEADRMFDLGFIKDVRYLARRMPPPERRLSMLFSATLSYRVMELAYEHMNNPKPVKVRADEVTVAQVREVCYYPANEEKIPLLLGLLGRTGGGRSMVFVNTKHAAETVWGYLEGNGFRAGLLSGDVPQPKRERLLEAFKRGELNVLVATDVAARGLHIPDVSHVFNYDLPQDAEDYVHRIGRTARAGASGDAVSFACEKYAYSLLEIQDYIGHNLPTAKITPELLVAPKPPVRRPRRRRDGGRDRRRGEARPGGAGRGREAGRQRPAAAAAGPSKADRKGKPRPAKPRSEETPAIG